MDVMKQSQNNKNKYKTMKLLESEVFLLYNFPGGPGLRNSYSGIKYLFPDLAQKRFILRWNTWGLFSLYAVPGP